MSLLLSPTKIGNLELRNRVAMAPMGVEIAEADGIVREPTAAYYAERARGGVGLLITENTSATYPRGANSPHELGVSDDTFLPGLSLLADAVHEHGSKLAIQLAHHGKVARLDTLQGRELLMPSVPRDHGLPRGPLDLSVEEMTWMARAAGGGAPKVHEATSADLEQLAADFADAADRARRAGIDAIELHGAHGYIFSEFLSPAWNFREDAYGGPVENRARLLCDVLRACKTRVGADFPIWCRIDAVEFGTPNGIVLEDAGRTAELLEEAGADAIHVSAYANPLGAGFTDAPLVHREGGFLEFAAQLKSRVSVPVIAAGRISPERGERALRDGQADLIAMGRQLLADPETVAKLERGLAEQVRPCVYCYVCVAQPFFDRRVRCSVNPVAAEELQYAELLRTPSMKPKRVVVVGGGPAGAEAASVAALRGHQVTLFEKRDRLGGTLRFAALPYAPNEALLYWLEARVQQLPIDLRLGQEATADRVAECAPDVVIAAHGAVRERCTIPGAAAAHVFDGDDLRELLAGGGSREGLGLAARLALRAGRLAGINDDPGRLRRASRLYLPLGRRVVVIGGGLVGAELADFFSERGRQVSVLEAGPVLALEMAHPRRWRVLHELRERGVRLEVQASILEIGPEWVRVEVPGAGAGERRVEEIAADSVILATGLAPNPAPVEALRAAGLPVTSVGDVNGVGYIEGAIHQGFHAAIDL